MPNNAPESNRIPDCANRWVTRTYIVTYREFSLKGYSLALPLCYTLLAYKLYLYLLSGWWLGYGVEPKHCK